MVAAAEAMLLTFSYTHRKQKENRKKGGLQDLKANSRDLLLY